VKRQGRKRLALSLVALAAVGWPLSALTFARHEPQVVLGLSWLAIFLGAPDALFVVQEGEDST